MADDTEKRNPAKAEEPERQRDGRFQFDANRKKATRKVRYVETNRSSEDCTICDLGRPD